MKMYLIGVIVVKSTGNWTANLLLREQGDERRYVAVRHIQGFPKAEWSDKDILHLLDSIEEWLQCEELVVRRLKEPVKI